MLRLFTVLNTMELIDAHAHLLWPSLYAKIDEIIGNAIDSGVSHIVNIGIGVDEFKPLLELSRQYPMVASVIGIHPENFAEPQNDPKIFRKLFAQYSNDIAAVGEIGLDYFQMKDKSQRKASEVIFRQMLQLAVEFHKPVVIHCRNAEKHAIRILEEPEFAEIPGVLMHCFGGADKHIQRCLTHPTWLFTISTSIVYKALHQHLAEVVPLERLMLETDAPFLKPYPDLEYNEPKHVLAGAEAISKIKKIPLDRVAEVTTAAAKNFFKLV